MSKKAPTVDAHGYCTMGTGQVEHRAKNIEHRSWGLVVGGWGSVFTAKNVWLSAIGTIFGIAVVKKYK